MTRYLFILGFLFGSCCSKKSESLVAQATSNLSAEFDAASWDVRLRNKSNARIMTGVEFFSIDITSEDGVLRAQSVRGVLGDYERYVIIPPGGERTLAIADELKHPESKYQCELYYVDDLTELPRTFEFSFESP